MIDTLRTALAAVYIALMLGIVWTASPDQPDPLDCIILCEG